MLRSFLMLAAFFGFTGVALGAFAAHGLKNRLSADYLAIFHTGVTYQLVHALALFGVALLVAPGPGALALLCCTGAAVYAVAGFLLGAFDAVLPPRLLRLRGASVRTPRS